MSTICQQINVNIVSKYLLQIVKIHSAKDIEEVGQPNWSLTIFISFISSLSFKDEDNVPISHLLFLIKFSNLEIHDVDMKKFSCIPLAYDAIKKGGSSIQNFTNTDGDTGFFQKQFKVYQRENFKCTNKNCS